MDFNVITALNIDGLPLELGFVLWNRAIDCAPYDTGNLRRSILMTKNSSTKKQYVYNAMNALYLDYLEKGQGPIKKHKGYISEKTVGVFIAEIIYYLKTGRTSTVATIPQITLKTSKQGPMFYEKRIMKKFDVAWQKLTADDRQKMSRFKYGTKSRLTIEKELIKGSQSARLNRIFKLSDNVFIDEKEGE